MGLKSEYSSSSNENITDIVGEEEGIGNAEAAAAAVSKPRFRYSEPDFEERDAGLNKELVAEWLTVLLRENSERVVQQQKDSHDWLFVNQKSVEYLFTICLRLRLPQDIKYTAIAIFNSFMRQHVIDLYERILKKPGRTDQERINDWGKVFTTMSRQIPLRLVSSLQIATKLHSFTASLDVDKARLCLKSLGFAYTEEAICKSELRVLKATEFGKHSRQTPITYVETFIDLLVRMNPNVEIKVRTLWEYSLLFMDCMFLNMDEFYKRITQISFGRSGKHPPADRLALLKADFSLMAAGVILTASLCVHGQDLLGSFVSNLQEVTGIPLEDITSAYMGIFRTLHNFQNTKAWPTPAELLQNGFH